MSWKRIRSVLDQKTNTVYYEPSDIIFLYRDEKKLINGLLDSNGVYYLSDFVCHPDKFNTAVGIAKSNI